MFTAGSDGRVSPLSPAARASDWVGLRACPQKEVSCLGSWLGSSIWEEHSTGGLAASSWEAWLEGRVCGAGCRSPGPALVVFVTSEVIPVNTYAETIRMTSK